jgi:Na+/H+ antiporter NhaA
MFLEKSLSHWVNDGLMVIFFYVVGMEIKREVMIGELSSFKKAALPISPALSAAGPVGESPLLPPYFYSSATGNDLVGTE